MAHGGLTEVAGPQRYELGFIDTWQRARATPGCGYEFNYWHWPLITAPLPPEREIYNAGPDA